MDIPDFVIASSGPIGAAFVQRGMGHFAEAAAWVKGLPYGRNADKDNAFCVLEDGCGTCSTKHALLQRLCIEQDFADARLMLGVFAMNGTNTPPVATVLQQYQLPYMPEAHNYLRIGQAVLDCTAVNPVCFEADLLEEIAIAPYQITAFKIQYHQTYLVQWLASNTYIPYTLEQLWDIRERCIAALASR
jgi:hypothetical protein